MEPMISLNLADRCDRCGAGAKHVAQKAGHADLLFCNHHMFKTKHETKHFDALVVNGWSVLTDQSAIERDLYNPLTADINYELISQE